MSFLWPFMLIFLGFIPLLAGIYIWLQRRHKRKLANLGSLGTMQSASGSSLGARRYLPMGIFLAGLAILTLAMARPQMTVALPRQEGTVILAFDVSGSMAADDLMPTRMDAAKAAARDFIQRQPKSVQIGVVAFSDSGFAVQPPTGDQDAILAAINRLTPQRGTSLANGIQGAMNTIDAENAPEPLLYSNRTPDPTVQPTPVPSGTYTAEVIVLLTDGENNEAPDPLAAAQTAADRGIRIYTVGIGSAAGTTVHINGFSLHTQLDEATLQKISEITGGTYYNATNTQDLIAIYDHLDPKFVLTPLKTEVTALFAGASMLLFITGGAFSLGWFNRLP